MRSNPAREGRYRRPTSFSITLSGVFNPLFHHPSWYYTIGQLAKDEVAAVVQHGQLHVTPALSRFRTPTFGVACTPDRWRIVTREPNSRLRILQIAVKTFENLLPEARLEGVSFSFSFVLEAEHKQVVEFLSKMMWNLMPAESEGEIAATLMSAVHTDPPRRKKLLLGSQPSERQVRLKVSFSYPLVGEKVFTLRQLSMADDYELDYEEAATYAEQLVYTLANPAQEAGANLNN